VKFWLTLPSSQATEVPAHWKISENDTELLLAKYDTQAPATDALTDSELRDYARMKKRFSYKIYARFTPMKPDDVQLTSGDMSVCWSGGRGWFDELVKINQRGSADAGWPWTGNSLAEDGDPDQDLSDSYFEMDIADWELQQERDPSREHLIIVRFWIAAGGIFMDIFRERLLG